ncbi:oligogalacturonate lyase [Croceibacterium mercuriale]|uniref:Oligogalacturonate lyase n=1 Tax=Croceibacterium mercuriale TaxID=1572751 RepID=A0A0B2C4G0_9SPHN|nr:oligogalacturonate lyase family protein [Croceibacterium mercuriale]KHL26886.1 oligogalacturonate lyase [Croceibacterium mercuriale]
MKFLMVAALALVSAGAGAIQAQERPATLMATPGQDTPPKEWIDQTTGHRIVRISDEAGSSSNYFNVNSYTPDGRWMAYSSPSGIMALDLGSFQSKLIVPGGVSLQFVGHRTGDVYYITGIEQTQGHDANSAHTPGAAVPVRNTARREPRAIMAYSFATGQSRMITTLDPEYSVATINADETLFAGARITGGAGVGENPGSVMANRDPADEVGPNGEDLTYAEGREVQINRRLTMNIPMEIFTINIRTGEKKTVTASTDWLNHLQFSPTDPNLLLYCHEGNWHVVDRMWLVRVDRPDTPKLIHTRTMNMEIAGHEWWSQDGSTVWYDLQTPRGEDFWVAGYNVETGKRMWNHLDRNSWGVHFNSNQDDTLFSSDGGDAEMAAHAPDGKYIWLLRPRAIPDVAGIHAANSGSLITPGVLDPEQLVDLRNHDYRSEPNASFTPDGKWLVFRSNMWGPGHVYAVELAGPSGTGEADAVPTR